MVTGWLCLKGLVTNAAIVWNGPIISFTNVGGSDPTLAQNQDRMTPNIWITRGSFDGIYNAAKENRYTDFFSPADTAWAFGSLSNYATLNFTDWQDWFGGAAGGGPPATIGKDAVVHLVSEDIYLSVKFTSWGTRGAGGFSYDRSTAMTPEPSAGLMLLAGVGGLGAYRARTKRRR